MKSKTNSDRIELSRREMISEVFSKSLTSAGLFAFAPQVLAQTVCSPTPAQTEGPFYPAEGKLGPDNDLTRKPGRPEAKGLKIYIQGVISDQQCRPVAGARVEIWQACHTGKYDHENDPNPAPLDPNFQYSGYAITDAHGRYMFKTIIPGAYPAGQGWVRPSHIHYKVTKLGYHDLITQLYFKGNPLNDKDHILNALPPEEREKVVIPLQPTVRGYDPMAQIGVFNISLRSVR